MTPERSFPSPTGPLALLALLLLACSTSAPSTLGEDAGAIDGDGAPPAGDGAVDAGNPYAPCTVGARSCGGTEIERVCENVNGEPTWVASSCDPYNYCVEDRCVPDCLDECVIGDTRNGNQTCRLFSEDSQSFVALGDGSHDLARDHVSWVVRDMLANGYVANTVYANTNYQTPISHTGTVDSAEWTGMYMSAESMRLMETRSPDAEANLKAAIERAHQLFQVTGAPGYMARIWAPLGQSNMLSNLYHPDDPSHFATTFKGGPAFFHAWTSRDMYAGMSLGLGFAYDAIQSEEHRELIREVVLTLAGELIKQRTAVPVRVRYKVFGSWLETDLEYEMENVVLVPSEMQNGRVFIQVGSDESSSDYAASSLQGAIEFLPNFTAVLGQTPAIGSALPEIPRPSSAMMLANFIKLAMHVTDGVPGRDAEHAQFSAYFEAKKSAWLGVMKQYAYHNEEECWHQYFGMTIAYHPIYSLLRLLEDGPYKSQVAQEVLADKMRPFVDGHHNAYFDYIAASQGPAGLVAGATVATTSTQLAGFQSPPKAAVSVDNRGSYPASTECPNQSSAVIDVADRVPVDHLWQHHPFRITNDQVGPTEVYPGIDYLVAYWMGRHYNYIDDDGGNHCARWD